ncbi:hypothetical protein Rs2_27005 [Raphanus sativus]|nr:hypothetical protein Rs2_27005 [Raphanus sativus]
MFKVFLTHVHIIVDYASFSMRAFKSLKSSGKAPSLNSSVTSLLIRESELCFSLQRRSEVVMMSVRSSIEEEVGVIESILEVYTLLNKFSGSFCSVVAADISAQLLPWSYAVGYLDIFHHSLRNRFKFFDIRLLFLLLLPQPDAAAQLSQLRRRNKM